MKSTFAVAVALASASVAIAANTWSFQIFQELDCQDLGTPLNQTGSGNVCEPPLEYSFTAVKILDTSNGTCTINFVNDPQDGCTTPLGSSPGSIKYDGTCQKLPSGVTSYGVVCK
ncbi:hypothetical protein CONPUDRAFT_147983 [Coniophora puteana RWD-64-598 SS2]|uniref:Uncharacterized protein n=1 Tax=Coniophora puteana (strain RWD-64-598) TaxID=741705 RepID=R7SCR0_CONPW|nr:uncharacterized protein CONPUDRAFT_147983 [Coniophora puteana RWD-64-598 SS2]EIW73956.1 hypothetical protein CONPUDRAFT_147983 [Coniophora puteana RWD-64-598 SS2]